MNTIMPGGAGGLRASGAPGGGAASEWSGLERWGERLKGRGGWGVCEKRAPSCFWLIIGLADPVGAINEHLFYNLAR